MAQIHQNFKEKYIFNSKKVTFGFTDYIFFYKKIQNYE